MSDAQNPTPALTTAPTPPRSPKERANRSPLMDFTQKWAGQIGITVDDVQQAMLQFRS